VSVPADEIEMQLEATAREGGVGLHSDQIESSVLTCPVLQQLDEDHNSKCSCLEEGTNFALRLDPSAVADSRIRRIFYCRQKKFRYSAEILQIVIR